MPTKAIVQSYVVPHHESFDQYADSYMGDVVIERVGRPDEDRWGVFSCRRDTRLARSALTWRDKNPDAPIVQDGDNLVKAPRVRREIREKFHWPPQPSSRTDKWKAAHTFTLEEALYVCGVKRPRKRKEQPS